MGVETGRSIAFSVKNFAVIPLPGNLSGLSAGVPIAVDTPEEVQIKIDVSLEERRGGAYLFPLAADIKEMKGELSGKLTDTPPALVAALTAGTYTKSAVAGSALSTDGVTNIQGTTVAARVSVTPGTAATGDWSIVATGTNQYTIYNLATGASSVVNTSSTAPNSDTTSIPGATITTSITPNVFTVNDAAMFSLLNIGSSGGGITGILETVIGPTTYPVIPPQARIIGVATRRGVVYKFELYYTELEGIAYPMKQGGYVVPDFKARILQPPFNAAIANPWRFDMVA